MEMRDDGSYPTVLKATGNRANVQIDNEGAVHWIAGSDTRITDNAVVGESAIQANFRDAPPRPFVILLPVRAIQCHCVVRSVL